MAPRRGVTHPLLPGFEELSPGASWIYGSLICGCIALAAFCLLPTSAFSVDATVTTSIVGLGLWRWSWGGLHLVRALLYKWVAFPAMRSAARHTSGPPRLYVLVTSYRMSAELNAAVYGRLFDELAWYGVPAVVVACTSDPADAIILSEMVDRHQGLPPGTQIHVAMQSGEGKRVAMADGLCTIASHNPPPGSHVVLMDGDTLLCQGAISRTCAILSSVPTAGAATTDNIPLVKGRTVTREWYRVRMAHRHVLMASMGLSRKLLVLTGRFSVFRADIAIDPEFISAVRNDTIEHSRLGSIRMLTGDDKSTWFVVLKREWDMVYVPDVAVHPVEELPAGGFFPATMALMLRWYGNMARNNARALALGPTRCGLFFWWCLVDQRLSMWTSLVGPTLAVQLSITQSYAFAVYYVLWILTSRLIISLAYYLVSTRFHPLFPIVLYYSQFSGACIKIYAMFHQHKQKWTRQATGHAASSLKHRLGIRTSTAFMAASIGAFVVAIMFTLGGFGNSRTPGPPTGLTALLSHTDSSYLEAQSSGQFEPR